MATTNLFEDQNAFGVLYFSTNSNVPSTASTPTLYPDIDEESGLFPLNTEYVIVTSSTHEEIMKISAVRNEHEYQGYWNSTLEVAARGQFGTQIGDFLTGTAAIRVYHPETTPPKDGCSCKICNGACKKYLFRGK